MIFMRSTLYIPLKRRWEGVVKDEGEGQSYTPKSMLERRAAKKGSGKGSGEEPFLRCE